MTPQYLLNKSRDRKKLFFCLSLFCLLCSSTTLNVLIAASTISIRLEPHLIEKVTQKFLPHTEKRQFSGVLDLALTQHPWSVQSSFTITDVKYHFSPDTVGVKASVIVNTDGYIYTATATGNVKPSIEKEYLILEIKNLNLPLYIEILGNRIDMGSLSAGSFLPPDLKRATINLSQFGLNIIIPKNKRINIRPVAPTLIFEENALIINSPLNF